MGRLIKYMLLGAGALIALLAIAIIAFALLFDPNDYRDTISGQVKKATGRDLVIDGDLGLTLFPWVAIQLGETRLSNATGFGDKPFVKFAAAELSVRLMPMLLHREVEIGTARLDGLEANLAVDQSGRNNWQDLVDHQQAAGDSGPAEGTAGPAGFAIGSIEINHANLVYDDRQAGDRYEVHDLTISSGKVQAGEPVDLNGNFSFSTRPADLEGEIEFSSTVSFDSTAAIVELEDSQISGRLTGLVDGGVPVPLSLAAPAIWISTGDSVVTLGELTFSLLDVKGSALLEPFSYAGELAPTASLRVDAFSPRSLLQALGIEAPQTADPAALGKLRLDANAAMTADLIRLSDITLVLDETTFTGEISVPKEAAGSYRLQLAGDRIDLGRYMAPTGDDQASAATTAGPPLEIPVDMIRALNARGTLSLDKALLGGMEFDGIELGVNSGNGQLRINPISARFFEGSYQGDVRINATGKLATLSVNEKIQDVNLAPMARALFDRDNITGLINGSFVLSGRGNDMSEIQQTLQGELSFTLSDGAYEGTDIWYQLRRARALFRKEAPPEPRLPPRTPFSKVSATGVVTDGIMRNEDFLAELPFMRLNGHGTVNFVTTAVDYSLSGRVFERPELVDNASAEEIADLTKAVVPLKITGTLVEPKIGVDIGGLLTEGIKDKLRDRLLDKLGGKQEEPAEGEARPEEKSPEQLLKDKLKGLLGN